MNPHNWATTWDEAEKVLEELHQAGAQLFAPPPDWTLRISPPGLVKGALLEQVKLHKHRLVWWAVRMRYDPDELTQFFLDTVANFPMDMKERAEVHQKNANKLLALDVDLEEFQESVKAYRSIMIAARNCAVEKFGGLKDG